MTLQIRRLTRKGVVVCFNHAILRALAGENVYEEIDFFHNSGNDMRSTSCQDCEDGLPIKLEYTSRNLPDCLNTPINQAKIEIDRRKKEIKDKEKRCTDE
jgi:heterodisulfide reductase subunit B